MKFSSMLLFAGFWLLLVYAPVTHWVWGGGWLGELGLLDFAGGTVVHVTAGVAALTAALVMGSRKGFPQTPMPPHNMTMTITGAGMLWVGWFGFNGGSALAANGDAGMAILVTHLSAASAAFAWMCLEWFKFGKPSALGAVTGMVAAIPSNRLMIETDAPYLLPRTLKTKPKNRRCEPMHLNEICEQVAMCTGKTKDFWALNTSRNAKSFFSLEKNK